MSVHDAHNHEPFADNENRATFLSSLERHPRYKDGNSMDWLHEQSTERERHHRIHSQHGIKGLLWPLADVCGMWSVIVLTGIGIGLIGAWLDIIVKWLSDLKEGHCSYGFLYNQVACCSGLDLDAGEICTEWHSWSQTLHVRSLLAQSLLQSFVYMALAVIFACSAAVLVKTYAFYAFHTGIPEIKAILGGYIFDAFLSPWTLLVKALGLALAVASGLSLGKEGPLVHVACCMADLLSRFSSRLCRNQIQRRRLLAAAAAAGVSVAFGSPLGGVLFGLEELDIFSNDSNVMWRGFVASVLAAMTLQYTDPFGTGKLVLFQVTTVTDKTWRGFELIPWFFLSVMGGILGPILIKFNVYITLQRHGSFLRDWPILEVVGAAAVTAAISYLIVFLRVQSSELVASLFQECDSTKGDFHGLCNPTAIWENVFLLTLTALIKFVLTAWTFGMMVPAGIFLPVIAIGACLGRAVGLLTQGLYRAYPTAWIFLSCPPDPSVRCISPGFYSVIGASAMLGGVTRMTISLVIILFELTGALSHVLPIMISVMTAKWIGDAFGIGGIYSVWIAMRGYPWLPPIDFKDGGETGAQIMKPTQNLVVIEDGQFTTSELVAMCRRYQFHGFPVTCQGYLLGYVDRETLETALVTLSLEYSQSNGSKCFFSSRSRSDGSGILQVNLSEVLDESVLQLRTSTPQETVVGLFQKLNLHHILFCSGGRLEGMVTKTDIVSSMTCQFSHTGALSGIMPGNNRGL